MNQNKIVKMLRLMKLLSGNVSKTIEGDKLRDYILDYQKNFITKL